MLSKSHHCHRFCHLFCIPRRDSNPAIGVVFAIAHVFARAIAVYTLYVFGICFLYYDKALPRPFITKIMTNLVSRIALYTIFHLLALWNKKVFLFVGKPVFVSHWKSPIWNTKQQQTARHSKNKSAIAPCPKTKQIGEGWGVVRWTCPEKTRKWLKKGHCFKK